MNMRAFNSMSLAISVAVLLPLSVQSQTSSKYLHSNGQDCVQPTDGKQEAGRFHRYHFKNICDRSFSIRFIDRHGKYLRSNGIGPGSTGNPSFSNLICERDKDCAGSEWEVH